MEWWSAGVLEWGNASSVHCSISPALHHSVPFHEPTRQNETQPLPTRPATPPPGPLPFGRGEGEASAAPLQRGVHRPNARYGNVEAPHETARCLALAVAARAGRTRGGPPPVGGGSARPAPGRPQGRARSENVSAAFPQRPRTHHHRAGAGRRASRGRSPGHRRKLAETAPACSRGYLATTLAGTSRTGGGIDCLSVVQSTVRGFQRTYPSPRSE